MSEERTAQPKVSVIIPIYKVERYLVQCLESVVHQTLEELEIILLDEAEQDRCREIIDFYEQTDPRVVAVHEPLHGYGAKANRGLEMARGEYIAIVEGDDFIEPDMYEQMYECARRTGANVVKTPFLLYHSAAKEADDKSRAYIDQHVPREKLFTIYQFPELIEIHPSIWSCLYRASELREKKLRFLETEGTGYVDNRFYMDVYTRVDKLLWLDKPFYHWRRSSVTSSSSDAHWNRQWMLDRWNENLDLYSDRRFALSFASKACISVFNHYVKGWEFNEEEYEALVAFLRRIPEEDLLAAPRTKAALRQQVVRCRNDPEGFKKTLIAASEPEPEAKPEAKPAAKTEAKPEARPEAKPSDAPGKKKGQKKKATGGLWGRASAYFLLLGVALRAGVFRALAGEALCGALAAASGVVALLCVTAGALSAASRVKTRRKNKSGRMSE